MERIRTLSHCVYREKSATTGKLVAAMAKATAEFKPLNFDSVGRDEDGREYRYASLTAINRATRPALSAHGLWLHTDYGFDESGLYAVAVLEHDSGEFVSSALPVHGYSTIRRRKAAMTLMRRAAIEGLLGLSAEADDDGEACGDEETGAEEATVDPKWAENERLARMAIADAPTPAKVQAVIEKVVSKIEKGFMDPESLEVLKKLADERRSQISEPQEVGA